MKTVLITGGNSGIGKATVSALATMGYRTIFVARNKLKAEDSHFMLSNLLFDNLKNSDDPRIITVSSAAHTSGKFDPENLQSEKKFSVFSTYGSTKLMNLLFSFELADRLRNSGIKVNALHPGVVNTNFANEFKGVSGALMGVFKLFFITPEKGAETSVYLASSESVKNVTGKYFVKCNPVQTKHPDITH